MEDEMFNKKINLRAPDRPNIQKLSANSVLLKWKINQSIYPAILTGFRIQSRTNDNGAFWETLPHDVSPNLMNYEINDLKIGLIYRFRIVATYSDLSVHPSPPSIKFLAESDNQSVLPIPTIVEAQTLSSSEILIGWRFNDPQVESIDGFIISYGVYDLKNEALSYQIRIPEAYVYNYVLRNLTADTAYSIRIQSYSGKQIGEYSKMVVKETLFGEYSDYEAERDEFKIENQPTVKIVSWDEFETKTDPMHTNGVSFVVYLAISIVLGSCGLVFICCIVVFMCRRTKFKHIIASSNGLDFKTTEPSKAFLSPSQKLGSNLLYYSTKMDNDKYTLPQSHISNCKGTCSNPSYFPYDKQTFNYLIDPSSNQISRDVLNDTITLPSNNPHNTQICQDDYQPPSFISEIANMKNEVYQKEFINGSISRLKSGLRSSRRCPIKTMEVKNLVIGNNFNNCWDYSDKTSSNYIMSTQKCQKLNTDSLNFDNHHL